jgi:hypothetical protein
MSENETITHEELVEQIEEAYKEREKLFRSAEQMTAKTEYDEWENEVFGDKQLVPAVRIKVPSENIDFIADGFNRKKKYGEQLKELEPIICDNKGEALVKWRQVISWNPRIPLMVRQDKLRYIIGILKEQFKIEDKKLIIQYLQYLTKLSEREVYRLLPEEFKRKKLTSCQFHKPRRNRCDTCQYKNETFELKNRINELNSQLMKLKSESKEQLKEELSNNQYELEQIIALFLKKHPSKEIVNGGLIQDKLE